MISLLKNGEDIIITKADKPIAKLISYKPKKTREPDKLKGKISFKEDFDGVNDEIIELFEGNIN